MIKRFFLLLMLFPSLLWAAGRGDETASEAESSRIFTSNYPLYFAAESLIGDSNSGIELLWFFSGDEDPAFWEPSREDLAEVQAADLLILNGADYEKWRSYAFLDESRVVDSSEGFADLYIETGKEAVHSHGGGAEHSHGGTAFTLWLDLKQYERQLKTVEMALRAMFPEREEAFQENSDTLQSGVRSLDSAFREAGAPFQDEVFLASHPVYQYFARAYLGDVKAMLWEPGLFPSEEEWAALEALKEESGARFMLWEDEPLPETRKRLEEMGLQLIIIRPGFSMPGSATFMDIMKANLEELQQAAGLL